MISSSYPTPPPITSVSDGTDGHEIVVALIPIPIGSGGSAFCDLFTRLVERGLSQAGVAFRAQCQLPLPGCALGIYDVTDRGAATLAMQETLSGLGLDGRWGIAYNDHAEGYWRPVAGSVQKISEILTPDNFRLARLEINRSIEANKRAMEYFRRLQEGGTESGEQEP